jgi:hypothetical protein
MGTGKDNVGWLTSLNNAMTFIGDHGWEITYWSAGPWFSGGYPYDVDAQTVMVNGSKANMDAIQMAVLSQQAKTPAPLDYFLSGPRYGHTGAPSDLFTLTYRGYITKEIDFTCYVKPATGGGGAVLAFSKTCAVGYNCDAQFTVTTPANANYTVYCQNSGGLINAIPLPFMSSNDLFIGAAAAAANVFSLRHLYTSYDGPLVPPPPLPPAPRLMLHLYILYVLMLR